MKNQKKLIARAKSVGVELENGDVIEQVSEEQLEALYLLKKNIDEISDEVGGLKESIETAFPLSLGYSGSVMEALERVQTTDPESGLFEISEKAKSLLDSLLGEREESIQGVKFLKEIYSKQEAQQWLKEKEIKFDQFSETESDLIFLSDEAEEFEGSSLSAFEEEDGIWVLLGVKKVAQKSYGVQKAFWGEDVSFLEKEDPDEQFVLGIVLEPNDGSDGEPMDPDTDLDVYSPEEVRKAAHWYMTNGRKKGTLHGKRGGYIMGADDQRVVVVESYILPVDLPPGTLGEKQTERVKKGSWLAGFKINDPDIWADLKSGVYDALSIGGDADEIPLEEQEV